MKDKQRETFERLISKELPETVEAKSAIIDDELCIDFSLININTENKITDENGTVYVPVNAECRLYNKFTTESITFSVTLLKLPVYQELGFMICNNYMQMLDSYDKTAGLHTSRKSTQSNDIDKAVIQSNNFRSVGFVRDNAKMYTELKLKGRVKDSILVSPSTFLRAVSGMSVKELITKFGYDNDFVVSIFDGSPRNFPECKEGFPVTKRADCIQAVYVAIFGKKVALDENSDTISTKLSDINRWLFDSRYFSKDKYAVQQIQYMQSFSHRASGTVLASTVSSNGITVEAGTALTAQILRELDATEISEIRVTHNGMDYVLHRFAPYWFGALNYTLAEDVQEAGLSAGTVLTLNDIDHLNGSHVQSIRVRNLSGEMRTITRTINECSLTLDDVFAVFDIWVNNLGGLNTYDKEFDLTNRMIVPFDKRVTDIVSSHLDIIVRKITDKYNVKGVKSGLDDYIDNFDKEIRIDAIIDQIRSSDLKLGQQAEMCNAMSFLSKDYKSTIANLKNIDDNLVSIQDHQYGRTDPFDVPESKKLASVQYRTVLSKTNEAGYITVPYLRVEGGKIMSDEPVYLTAIDETDRFIAEWDETFHNPDGSMKQYVSARYNGEIVSTSVNNVSYKECSPYSGMSIAHSCVVFPGHSDGKRITMACNQIYQATPMAHTERPYVNGGGESMVEYGFYRAETLLENFYNSAVVLNKDLEKYKDRILNSDLRLITKHTEHGVMRLNFRLLEMESVLKELPSSITNLVTGMEGAGSTYELEVPYGMQTTDNTLMSFKINPVADNVYHPGDIVCYSNSCSISDKDHLDFMDTGAHKIESSALSRGLALVKNLRVGYKTWEGSTIDDAITISDDCIYDDILTSIYTTRIILSAKTFSETEYERFGVMSHKYSYFEENGLPKVGTYLNAGDPVIAKILHSNNDASEKYKYLKMNQSGQVVFAGFTMKNNEEVAEVVLAQRAVVEVGDKFAGRCGNKGVVAKIVPAEQMPYDPETGFRLQIMLNPLGIPSRQNISQFLDVDLTECLRQDDKISYVSPYKKDDLQLVLDMKKSHGVKPKIFIDGRTGKPFERPIHWGTISIYKLHHMVKKKYHAIGMSSPVDPVYMQPRHSSKLDGGQSFGEMEEWCLMSVGAKHILQEIYSYQSTDIKRRTEIRTELERGAVAPYEVSGNNSNNATMLACYRSLGVEFKTNTDEGVFEFHPLTDQMIRSFSVYPVDSVLNLHNSAIFHGSSNALESKDQSRESWGWIDLKMELIHPNFICNSKVLTMLNVSDVNIASRGNAEELMRGGLAIEVVHQKTPCFTAFRTSRCSDTNKYRDLPDDTNAASELVSGIEAIVMMFRYMDTESLESSLEQGLNNWVASHGYADDADELGDSPAYADRLKRLRFVKEFNKYDSLDNYIISAFPVMPQIYRPKFAGSRQTDHVDFDWHYAQILNAVAAMTRNRSIDTQYNVYDRIKSFCGLSVNQTKEEKKHKNIKTYFSGNNNGDHGKIRTNVQSKRVFCSGRSTIIPAGDTRMKPTEIGIPMAMAVKMYESFLIGLLASKQLTGTPINRADIAKALLLCSKRDKERFMEHWEKTLGQCMPSLTVSAYSYVTKLIYDFVEGRDGFDPQVIMCGRQPSLHRYAIRAYYPRIVLDNTIWLHTLVCHGYNADFDGDQSWVEALLSDEAKAEGIQKLSPMVDCINPKDNSLILKHTQDVVLGLYCMSMLEKNATVANIDISEIHHYQNLNQMELDMDAGVLHTYDFVCVCVNGNLYVSTAGRIRLNACLLGFTDSEFTNPSRIPGIDCTRYRELKYDGILRSGGTVKSGEPRYYKIADVCMEIYKGDMKHFMEVIQKLTEFGFYYADKFGISLSLEDLMLEPEDSSNIPDTPEMIELDNTKLDEICSSRLDSINQLKVQIEQDCYDGLISNEDKDDAIMTLYYNGTSDGSTFSTGVHAQVKENVMKKLSITQRNNNIFILIDSGARGNSDQLMRMCGFLPQLQKDKQNSLNTPVTNNFLHGLSSFDVHMTSYGIKQGLASTQNETPQAGYATHKSVYMASGMQVVESDCGKSDWWYDVKYGQINEGRTRFIPTMEWFNDNLVGIPVAMSDTVTLDMFGLSPENSVIRADMYGKLVMCGGFHSIQFNDGTIMDIPSIIGTMVHSSDSSNLMKLKNTLNGRVVTVRTMILLEQLRISEITTSIGTYTFRYRMDPCSRSLLLHRQCRNLPYTDTVTDEETGERLEVITEKTLDFIEGKNLRNVPARILLDCRCKNGVCSHCYGLKFSSLKFPSVGEFVGTESAQAMGEPSAQLTISLINLGGTAGAAINDGIRKFSSMLDGSVHDAAILAPRSGYVNIERLGNIATVSIRPVDKNCDLCNGCSFGGECPIYLDGKTPNCMINHTIDASALICKDGDWVEASQPLTASAVDPGTIQMVTRQADGRIYDTTEFKYVYRRKQTEWLESYFDTFHDKGIDINARHFELFTRIQNLRGFVYSSTNPDYEEGRTYEIPDLLTADGVSYKPVLSSRQDVIMNTSGAMAALSFERIQSIAARLCVDQYKDSYTSNASLLGAIAAGTDVISGCPKKFGVLSRNPVKRKEVETSVYRPVEYKEVEVEEVMDTDIFGGIDFDSLLGSEPEPISVDGAAGTASESSFEQPEPSKISLFANEEDASLSEVEAETVPDGEDEPKASTASLFSENNADFDGPSRMEI